MNILGNELSRFQTVPSESFYYDKFAYKINITAPIANYVTLHLNADVVDFLTEIHYLLKNCTGEFRRRYNRFGGSYTLYVSDYNDLVYLAESLDNKVIDVHGPINKQHLKKIKSNTALSVKKSLYFNEHTHKIELWHTFMDLRSMGMPRDKNKEVLQFLLDQDTGAKLRGSYWGHVTMYTSIKEFDQLRPFILMMFPKVKIRETERYVWPQS